jgi:signal transduction histidine kinase
MSIDGAVNALIEKGYLIEQDGSLRTCNCAGVRALRRAGLEYRLAEAIERLAADQSISYTVYLEMLEMVRHQQQATHALLSQEEQERKAQRKAQELMFSTAAFDLMACCENVARRVSLEETNVDVIWDIDETPLEVAGPQVWIDCLINECLTNSISAARREDSQEGTVWLDVQRSPAGSEAIITVSDNGPGFPDDVLIAFKERRQAQRLPERGTGLHRYRVFGESRGVSIQLGKRDGGGAVVQITIPIL